MIHQLYHWFPVPNLSISLHPMEICSIDHAANLTHILGQVQESELGYIGGWQIPSLFHQPCSHKNKMSGLQQELIPNYDCRNQEKVENLLFLRLHKRNIAMWQCSVQFLDDLNQLLPQEIQGLCHLIGYHLQFDRVEFQSSHLPEHQVFYSFSFYFNDLGPVNCSKAN